MDPAALSACYRLIAETFVYPDDRDRELIDELAPHLSGPGVPSSVRQPLARLLEHPGIDDRARYLETLELLPDCPLYVGHYLYAEPESCRGAASSERNTYMIELSGLYRQLGFQIHGELPDFLPAMLEFLALSLERPESELRQELIGSYLLPALPAMRERFDESAGPWALALEAVQALLWNDLGDVERPSTPPDRRVEVRP